MAGDKYFIVLVHCRWIKVVWQPRIVVGDSHHTGGEPCGDTERWLVCLVFLKRADGVWFCDKVCLYKSSGEYGETDVNCLS